MADYIVMPKLGFDMREAELVTWLKEIGDSVEKGEIVAEIESDKATLELEAQAGGVLLKKLYDEGALVAVGDNIAIVGEEGEDVSGMEGKAQPEAETETEDAPQEAQDGAEPATPSPDEKTAPSPDGESAPSSKGEEFPGGVKATPVARRVADEHDVDLQQVSGSGPGGRIRKADVETYLEEGPPEREAVTRPAVEPTPVEVGPDSTEIETTRLRKAIARRMIESKTTVPHFYVTSAIDMDAALALRKQVNAMLPDEEKVTVNDLIVKAAALTLREFPNLNAAYAGDTIVHHHSINVGTAVAIEGGLTTVVQKNTDSSTLSKIAADHKAMIGRAREGKVRPGDVQGGTFTVSNLGAFDVENFIAIINPPEAAILAVGTANKEPVVRDGEISVAAIMRATISADHRVTDGAEAARFMQKFKEYLEEPMRLLI